MAVLFRVHTEKVTLTCMTLKPPKTPLTVNPPYGRLAFKGRRKGLVFGEGTWRAGVPEKIATDPDLDIGYRFVEQTDYILHVESQSEAARVDVRHRDPLLLQRIDRPHEKILTAVFNFGGQVGKSRFEVLVDGASEFDFELEVYPSKLDYESDYQALLADVQEKARALAFEYLRSTYERAGSDTTVTPTAVEWLSLLVSVAEDLAAALDHIAHRPIQSLIAEDSLTRADKVKRVNSKIRSAARTGAGKGNLWDCVPGVLIRESLPCDRKSFSLDTYEHRWIARQLRMIRSRLAELIAAESKPEKTTVRRTRVLEELAGLETQLTRFSYMSPFDVGDGAVPPGFASLQLISAPGYREAYVSCMLLSAGLELSGGPLELSVKDLNQLYEYWVYLSLVFMLSEELETKIPVEQLITAQENGMSLNLRRGAQTKAKFIGKGSREVTVTYNPELRGDLFLTAQKPDFLLQIRDEGWPEVSLVLDAKYRLVTDPEYVKRYGSAGPPEDALNVLYRYRDAIVHDDTESGALKRSVVKAAAVFPLEDSGDEAFFESKLWKSIDRLGVGAIPLMPGSDQYLRTWVRKLLGEAGWQFAEQAIDHRSSMEIAARKQAAREPVLIACLTQSDFDRVISAGVLSVNYTNSSLLSAQWIALAKECRSQQYEILFCGRINEREIVESDSKLCALLNFEETEKQSRLRITKQCDGLLTTKLAVRLAKNAEELLLRSDKEWRLFDWLSSMEIECMLSKDADGVVFTLHDGSQIRYQRPVNFLLSTALCSDTLVLEWETLCHRLMNLTTVER